MWLTKNPIVVALALLSVSACTSDPQYPNCRNDEACRRDGLRGRCVNGHCEQCIESSDCTQGQSCVNHQCAIPAPSGCQTDSNCPTGQ